MTTLTIQEETFQGSPTPARTLEFPAERITARELIRRYVYEEVRDLNQRAGEQARQLRGNHETEILLNLQEPTSAVGTPSVRQLDWEMQAERALDAFGRNRFFLMLDDRQVQSLDDEIVLRPDLSVSFLRLIPLAGG